MSAKHYICKDRYRLELRWDCIEYQSDEAAVLKGARFEGPVLKNSLKIAAPDSIDLDFTPQLVNLVSSYYIVKLSWGGVEYVGNTVLLQKAILTNGGIREFHKIDTADFVVINTEKHEEAVHAYNLVYESQIIRGDGNPYSYA